MIPYQLPQDDIELYHVKTALTMLKQSGSCRNCACSYCPWQTRAEQCTLVGLTIPNLLDAIQEFIDRIPHDLLMETVL